MTPKQGDILFSMLQDLNKAVPFEEKILIGLFKVIGKATGKDPEPLSEKDKILLNQQTK